MPEKGIIIYEGGHGPVRIDPNDPKTGQVVRVHNDAERTLSLQFPHPEGARERNSMRVAMVHSNAPHGFGAKTGQWHYEGEVEPDAQAPAANVGLKGFTTNEMKQEIQRREIEAAGVKSKRASMPANVTVEKGRVAPPPPEPKLDLEIEAKLKEAAEKRLAEVRSEAKFVRVKRTLKSGKVMTIPKIRPDKMRDGDVITGIVESK